MPELFKNKYRIESCRLKGWDYAQAGYYFITICTKNRIDYFGKIENGKIHLSHVGEIVKEEWIKTAMIRKNVILDEFIIMPNHIHGIIFINNYERTNEPIKFGKIVAVETSRRDVTTAKLLQPNSIGSIICQFKSICTKKINKQYGQNYFFWQDRYYDHVIREEQSLYKIREYIFNNPIKWKE